MHPARAGEKPSPVQVTFANHGFAGRPPGSLSQRSKDCPESAAARRVHEPLCPQLIIPGNLFPGDNLSQPAL